jgi:putative zinc finger/helix-turn-helix YgiT family protein
MTGKKGKTKKEATSACCGARAKITSEDQKFYYGGGRKKVELTARVRVATCSECGLMYTGQQGERARHEAVCAHLGRMSPREMIALRRNYGLSQEKWAVVTGFGSASIKRWERGAVIQNEASDTLLRLLYNRPNYDALRSMSLRS